MPKAASPMAWIIKMGSEVSCGSKVGLETADFAKNGKNWLFWGLKLDF